MASVSATNLETGSHLMSHDHNTRRNSKIQAGKQEDKMSEMEEIRKHISALGSNLNERMDRKTFRRK